MNWKLNLRLSVLVLIIIPTNCLMAQDYIYIVADIEELWERIDDSVDISVDLTGFNIKPYVGSLTIPTSAL